jgi:hypothetical protein
MKQFIIYIMLSFLSGIIASHIYNNGLITLFSLWSIVFGIISLIKIAINE